MEKQTHIEVEAQFLNPINRRDNIFGDGIAYVEQYDFSRANLNEENRIAAVSRVASICYQSPKSLGSISLYNKLMTESGSLPSSSAEFVPILLDPKKSEHAWLLSSLTSSVRKFGEWVEDGRYLLTNFRALAYDCEVHASNIESPTFKEELKMKYFDTFNTEAECDIIKKHFKVFLQKIDLPTMGQYVRHRASYQAISRRYVSGKRVPFESYISEKMKPVVSDKEVTYYGNFIEEESTFNIHLGTDDVIDICINHYEEALKVGVKPEEARRIIPQAAYSELWSGFQPRFLDNFLNLRCDSHAQWEIRKVAEAIRDMIGEEQ